MNAPLLLRQVLTVARLEARRAFFSKRSFWVYLLALFPAVIFIGHGISVKLEQNAFSARGITPAAVLDSIREGATPDEVIAQAGKPLSDRKWRRGGLQRRQFTYFDGRRRAELVFNGGELNAKRLSPLISLEEDRPIFAGVFQHFYLRLAVFFGCLGIFMNLFRGEMLSRTLHFWLLAPVRREVLLLGKYLAGLVASAAIFTAGTLLCYLAMLWPQSAADLQPYLRDYALAHASWYAAATVLACVGYGSFFLAAGLLVRNPIIPATLLLLWESVAAFLPSMLQKLSVLYYVQALCPVPIPLDANAPALARLFMSPAAPPSIAAAVAGLLALTALVLWLASMAVRKLQIDYGTD